MRDILKTCASLPVKVYRMTISPFMPPSCRFVPTCSAYMLQAIDRHGAFRGVVLGLFRLARCHPWHRQCGPDPVPERFDWADVIGYKRRRQA